MLCEAENFLPAPRGSNSTTFLRLPAGAHGQPRARVPDVVARGFRAHTISGRGFNLFKPLRRHFRARPSCRLGKKFVERLGTDLEARKKAKTPQPLIRRLAARRDARRGFDGGRSALLDGRTSLTAWPWGCRVGETIKNPSTSCVYQKGNRYFSFNENDARGSTRALDTLRRGRQAGSHAASGWERRNGRCGPLGAPSERTTRAGRVEIGGFSKASP